MMSPRLTIGKVLSKERQAPDHSSGIVKKGFAQSYLLFIEIVFGNTAHRYIIVQLAEEFLAGTTFSGKHSLCTFFVLLKGKMIIDGH